MMSCKQQQEQQQQQQQVLSARWSVGKMYVIHQVPDANSNKPTHNNC
jgi:hypothetical protein